MSSTDPTSFAVLPPLESLLPPLESLLPPLEPLLVPHTRKLKLPNGARLLASDSIFELPEKNILLKAGPGVEMSEAEAMRFVARETRIPVPEVIESYMDDDGNGYIYMSRLEGVTLGRAWEQLSPSLRLVAVTQVAAYLKELNSLRGDFYGGLWHRPCQDIFFRHLPFKDEHPLYGPYHSRQQYNEGLIKALERSTPFASLHGFDEEFINDLLNNNDERKVFSHGDLHLGNILVDESTGCITGILDWETAGFSIHGREYYEAKSRARRESWSNALDEIFDEIDRAPFESLQRLDRVLTQYTLI